MMGGEGSFRGLMGLDDLGSDLGGSSSGADFLNKFLKVSRMLIESLFFLSWERKKVSGKYARRTVA